MNDLSTNISAFCSVLRAEHHFAIGQAEAHDALRALDVIGIADEWRVRTALRLVCCATRDQTLAFDRAFDAFFRNERRGTPQPAYAPRNTRLGRDELRPDAGRSAERPAAAEDDGAAGSAGAGVERQPLDVPDDATAWQTLRARYSPNVAAAAPPRLDARDVQAMLPAADRLIATLRSGRSRRWKPGTPGGRFDLRRTIRASLQTGGEPVDLRYLGHPPRNPRIVVLVDGSRSMFEQTKAVLTFARALCERSSRTSVFVFSTELRDITRALRASAENDGRLEPFGAAWGGGTKIGANLAVFVDLHGARLLSPDTLVVVFSDGLDVGDLPQLELAMRTLDRRTAAVVWLNPHAATLGYRPSARGMQAALPYIELLAAANDPRGFIDLARRLRRCPRIAGRRR